MSHIAALLSGGVDSASALYKFIKDNPKSKKNISAYYLKIWLEDELAFLGQCPWEEDLFYAQKTAQNLDVPLKIIPLQHEYHQTVVSYTLQELKRGGTPSPDIFCNKNIKFGAFLNYVDADLVISGHYARLVKSSLQKKPNDHIIQLHRAPDPIKDQTYFLSHLHQNQLKKIEFPIGNMTKQEVRSFAHTYNLPPKTRKDSQGICFLGKIKYRDFVLYHLGKKQGSIIDAKTHKILGTHCGVWFYTIGQRSGLKLGGGPWYVCNKSISENIVWVCHADTIQKHTSLDIEQIHWINTAFADTTQTPKNIQVKLRHGPALYNAHIKYNIQNNTAHLELAQGDAGIAVGQIAVLYDNTQCVGCGRIFKNQQ